MSASTVRGTALLALLAGPFMSMVDSSAINVAIPEIVDETGRSLTIVGWSVSAYLLGIAATLPITTAVAARWGVVRTYTASLAAFGVASLLCALAPGIETLIAARALQGVTASALVPLALALLFGGLEAHADPDAQPGPDGDGAARSGWSGSPVAGLLLFLAPALGPTLGALVMQTPLGWRGIFLLNAPVVLVALLAARSLPRTPGRHAGVAIDLVAVLLLTAGSIAVALGATFLAEERGDRVAAGAVTAAAGVVLLLAWAVRVRRHPGSDVAPAVLGSARHRNGVVVSVLASVVLFGVLFLVPVYFVGAGGWSLVTAGLVLLPQGIAMGLAHPLGQALVARLGTRATVSCGLLVLAGSSALLVVLDTDTPAPLVAGVLVVRGVALGLTLQPMIVGLMSAVPPAQVTGVSTLFTITQRVGASLGIAMIAAFYHARLGGGADDAFHATALVLVAISLAALVPALGLPADGRRTTHSGGDAVSEMGDEVGDRETV